MLRRGDGVYRPTAGTSGSGYHGWSYGNPLGSTKYTWLGMDLKCTLSTTGRFYSHTTN